MLQLNKLELFQHSLIFTSLLERNAFNVIPQGQSPSVNIIKRFRFVNDAAAKYTRVISAQSIFISLLKCNTFNVLPQGQCPISLVLNVFFLISDAEAN
jgi:hypothetical protein